MSAIAPSLSATGASVGPAGMAVTVKSSLPELVKQIRLHIIAVQQDTDTVARKLDRSFLSTNASLSRLDASDDDQ